MLYSILLRFHAPLQSYGAETVFKSRDTESFPTKSAIIGFLGACLGRKKGEDISDLNKLTYTVITEESSTNKMLDFQVSKERKNKTTFEAQKHHNILTKSYLMDTTFFINVEFDDKDFRDNVYYQLFHPVYTLYLGRKACPPSLPYVLGKDEYEETEYSHILTTLNQKGYGVKKPVIYTTKDWSKDNSAMVIMKKDTPVDTSRFNRKFAANKWYRVV